MKQIDGETLRKMKKYYRMKPIIEDAGLSYTKIYDRINRSGDLTLNESKILTKFIKENVIEIFAENE